MAGKSVSINVHTFFHSIVDEKFFFVFQWLQIGQMKNVILYIIVLSNLIKNYIIWHL